MLQQKVCEAEYSSKFTSAKLNNSSKKPSSDDINKKW